MKILMMVFVAARKGAYWRAYHFARHLVQKGHAVTLMAMAPGRRRLRRYHTEGVTIVETPDLLWGPLRSGWDPYQTVRRILWLRRRAFDVVHVFDTRPTNLFPALFLQRRGVPLVLDWEDWLGRGGSVEERPNRLIRILLRPVETFFEERFRRRADATTVICTTLRARAEALGVPPRRITLIRDGADLAGLKPLAQRESRRRLGLPQDAPIIGYVGAIFYRDAELMGRAFDQLVTRLPRARLLLIGYVNVAVEKMVRAETAVIRTGFISYRQMNLCLAACSVCWLPYRDSGANRGRWPLKLNDYMCVARPTVATAVGDVAGVITTHQIGLLAEDNPDSLAAQTERLLTNPGLATYLGTNARCVAEAHFGWSRRTRELEQVYADVLSRRARLAL